MTGADSSTGDEGARPDGLSGGASRHDGAVGTDDLVKALRTVYDPEIPINVHDLGLIYGLDVDGEANVNVRMTLTAPNCPMAELIVKQVEQRVRAVDGVRDVTVELVWEPKWDPDMMSEAAKLELEFTGHTGPAHLRKDKFSSLTVRKTDHGKRS